MPAAEDLAYHDYIVSKYRPSVLVPNLRDGVPTSGVRSSGWGGRQSVRYADGATLTHMRLRGETGTPPGAGLYTSLGGRDGAAATVVRLPGDVSTTCSVFGWAYVPDTSKSGAFVAISNRDESGSDAGPTGVHVGVGDGSSANAGDLTGVGNRCLMLYEAVAWNNDTSTNWGTGWVSFGATANTSTMTIYKNGALAVQRSGVSSPSVTGAQYVCVGGYQLTGGATYNRRTDCAVIWAAVWANRVLTAAEYLDLHQAGLNPAMHRAVR